MNLQQIIQIIVLIIHQYLFGSANGYFYLSFWSLLAFIFRCRSLSITKATKACSFSDIRSPHVNAAFLQEDLLRQFSGTVFIAAASMLYV